ncbi:maltodextrin phosphorylase [Desulfotomaculum arcticum]|uniref:glycogen phosphorylase n=1 Tax=Desulfotruncus arcticus DSM 17038 TaxID=1121424 RepID=A0A1I2YHJ7_9FIRM|nr:alpha-glucan family phosphorylase [Desulfotruncus arcticus]SFH24859.1 maltodextrin phosphorylase [Desulfotomaculum arcticum] [Desulfotruncus arcticus DSM 17038]
MYPYRTISIIPRLPESIGRLRELAYNLWYSWNDQAMELFRFINPRLWEEVYHNPVQFLLRANEDELNNAAENKQFTNNYRKVMDSFDHYMQEKTWYDNCKTPESTQLIAYFSAEFGVHESHPTYSGGLGLLAGDHCKAASDLGLPFVGVGLLYKQGYFTQLIDSDGNQKPDYPFQNFSEMPITPVIDETGRELIVDVKLPGRRVYARIWKMLVGRVCILFLDADLTANRLEDRALTGQLYGGDKETRISQEILLGRAGVRALRAMGLKPTVWHINEGHAAFLLIERVRELAEEQGLPLGPALEAVRADSIFTTHTPVPAGHDVFTFEMVDRYYSHLYERMGLTREQLLELAKDLPEGGFNMTLLALRFCGHCNGVSRLHGEVSRAMFHHLYQGIPVEEVPISHITNGIHTLTWLAPELRELFNTYFDHDWEKKIANSATWAEVDAIPDKDFWQVHTALKAKALDFARKKLIEQRTRNQETFDRVKEVENYLTPNTLTIGFARRFATYKRANLIFSNKDQLLKLLNNPNGPVQLIFAGKAHPADTAGQELIKQINDLAAEEQFRGKIIFLENYDINVARCLVQGVDVWLNTPRRPMEASGTSGMKAALNGVLNCSILDGWWPEAYNGENGFSIGADWDFNDEEAQDKYDYNSLLTVLNQVIIPAFYDRQPDGTPVKWIQKMKQSIKTIAPRFSTERMVTEYTEKFYLSAMQRNSIFTADNYQMCQEMYKFKQFLINNWHNVQIINVQASEAETMPLGDELFIQATVRLKQIPREYIQVEIAYGEKCKDGLFRIHTLPLTAVDSCSSGDHIYEGSVALPQGNYGYTVRVRPNSPYFTHHFELPLVCWAPSF